MTVTPVEAMLDLLSLQVGLKDHHCLMCPVTHKNLSRGSTVVSLHVLCTEDTRPSITAQISSDHKRYDKQGSRGTFGPGFPVGPLAPRPPRGPCRDRNSRLKPDVAQNFLLVVGSYVPLDPSVLWDQLFLQLPVKRTKINTHTHTHTHDCSMCSAQTIYQRYK